MDKLIEKSSFSASGSCKLPEIYSVNDEGFQLAVFCFWCMLPKTLKPA